MSYSWIILVVTWTFLFGPGGTNPSQTVESDGELMHYKLKYSIFQVGVATVSCKVDGEGDINKLTCEVRSNGLVKLFNNMHYYLECDVDPVTGLPDSAIINLKDRKHSFYNELIFQQDVRSDSAIVISKLTGTRIVSKDIYEALTGFIHFRKDLIDGRKDSDREVLVKIFYPDDPWDLRFYYVGQEELKTALGPQLCYRYNPRTIPGKFFVGEDDMSVYFTKDKPHIPVRFRLNLRIGSIRGVLKEYSNSNVAFSSNP